MLFVKLKLKLKKYLLRDSLLWKVLDKGYRFLNGLGRLKGPLGTLPDFLIIGAQKGGTTALYHYLIQHPDIKSATTKEIHYFSDHAYKPLYWYKSYFPIRLGKKRFLTGEASTSYLLHPQAAKRAHEVVPEAKIICLLRDPVDRAYSHYQHQVRRGRERETFEKALEKEASRIKGEEKKLSKNPHYYSYAFDHFSYQKRGDYADQLKRWQKRFDEVLVITSEDLFEKPEKTMKRIFEFLGLKPVLLELYEPIFKGGYSDKMKENTRTKLRKYFQKVNGGSYEEWCERII